MNSEIYYFTGTGNSLHVAKELQKRMPDTKLIPIISVLKEGAVRTSAENVGFVFPIYMMDLPIPVKQFLNKVDTGSAQYIFAAATRVSTFYIADIHIEKALRKQNKKLDSFFVVNMAANSPCGLAPKSMPGFKKMINDWTNKITIEKVNLLEPAVQDRLQLVSQKVINRERHKDERSALQSFLKRTVSLIITPLNRANGIKPIIPYFADSTCNGCEKCERICPSGRVKMRDHKPEWQMNVPCYYCYACFNVCPEQAILIKRRYEKKEGRYLYPGIGVKEISGQKGSK
ncbi:Ferredoxin [Chitinispirillum alkaliphilum]|nr:Ferredoxin [Chitinispirillum alkaliphilum]